MKGQLRGWSLRAVVLAQCALGALALAGCGSSTRTIVVPGPEPADTAVHKAQAQALIGAVPKPTTAGATERRPLPTLSIPAAVVSHLLTGSGATHVDYVDVNNIHWLGSASVAAASVALDLTGTTNATSFHLIYTYSLAGNSSTAVCQLHGTLPRAGGGVEQADLDTTTVATGTVAGGTLTVTTAAIGSVLGRDSHGNLVAQRLVDDTTRATLAGTQLTVAWTFDHTDDVALVLHTRGTLTVVGDLVVPTQAAMTGTVTGDTSSGLTLTVTYAADGGVSGTVKASDLRLVGTLSGNTLVGGLTIVYADGTVVPLGLPRR